MKGIPTIGGASGLFEVFVPGLFLLLNLIGVVYFIPLTPESTRTQLLTLFSNPALGLVIAIGFGYLMGVILRIFRADVSDKWSGKYLRVFDKNCRGKARRGNLYGHENFPYTGWLGVICQNSMPLDVLDFYYDHWAHFKITNKTLEGYKTEKSTRHKLPEHIVDKIEVLKGKIYRKRVDFLAAVTEEIGEDECKRYEYQILRYACLWGRRAGRQYFNFVKTMIISNDDRLGNEIYSRSSLSRYISGMYYALLMATSLLFIAFGLQFFVSNEINSLLLFLVFVYFIAILAILKNLRYMRVGETQTVLYAAYKNKSIFEGRANDDNTDE